MGEEARETKSLIRYWEKVWNNRGLLDVTTSNFVEATLKKLRELLQREETEERGRTIKK